MYNLSTDYESLYNLICKGLEIPCFVYNELKIGTWRDIARVKRHKDFDITIGARGISYASIHPWHSEKGLTEKQLFIDACIYLQLEYVEPPVNNDEIINRLTQ